MVRLLLVMRAGELIAHRSGNCSSSVTGSAGGPSYKRTRLRRSKGKLGPARAGPLGSMLPSGPFWIPEQAELRQRDYQKLEIQGQALRLPSLIATAGDAPALQCRNSN